MGGPRAHPLDPEGCRVPSCEPGLLVGESRGFVPRISSTTLLMGCLFQILLNASRGRCGWKRGGGNCLSDHSLGSEGCNYPRVKPHGPMTLLHRGPLPGSFPWPWTPVSAFGRVFVLCKRGAEGRSQAVEKGLRAEPGDTALALPSRDLSGFVA